MSAAQEQALNALSNFRIGTRLVAGFAMVIALLVVLAIVGVTRIDAIEDDTEVILHDRFPKVALAQTIANEVNRQLRAMRTALIVAEPALVAQELAKIEASVPVVAEALDKLKASVHSDRGKAALAALVEARARFKEKEAALVDLVKAGKVDDARKSLVTDILSLQQVYLDAVDAFSKSQVDGMEQYGRQAAEMAGSAKLMMGIVSAIAVLLSVAVAYQLTRSIVSPIAEAVKVAQTVAAGDLTSHIEVQGRDETGGHSGQSER